MINPFSKPRTREEWSERARLVEERLQGLSIAELMRGAKHGDPVDRDGRGYDPNQPRVPAGNSDGGQWTNKAKAGGERLNDPRVLSDATPDNHRMPGAQYTDASRNETLSQRPNNATTNQGTGQKRATFLGTDVIANTRVTPNGEIVTEYYEPYCQMTPIEQEAVRVHEAVHARQLQPYANRGWLGYLEARLARSRSRNRFESEIEAYKAEYDFLNSYPTENLSQGMQDVLYYRRNAVRNNLEYFCRSAGEGKRPGC
jgi:hypothetical protein